MEENKIHWSMKVLFVIALVTFIVVWSDIIYRRYYPFVPSVVYGDIKIINEDKKVSPGGYLIYEVDIDRKMNVPTTIRRALANGYLITFDDVQPPENTLGRQKVRAILKVPRNTACGTWRLKWSANYEVTEGRKVTVSAKSEPFEVRK